LPKLYDFGFFDLFWIFLAFLRSSRWQRRQMEFRRVQALQEFERGRNSRVILLIHRQESISLLEFLYRATSP